MNFLKTYIRLTSVDLNGLFYECGFGVKSENLKHIKSTNPAQIQWNLSN